VPTRPPFVRRRVTAVAAIALAIALGIFVYGVFHDSDEDKVRETVAAFASAVRQRDYSRICDKLITTELRARVELLGRCAAVIRRAGGAPSFDPSFKVEVTGVEIDGQQATAKIETMARRDTSRGEVHLVKQRDEWRLSSFQ
jgi:hypothetical protein